MKLTATKRSADYAQVKRPFLVLVGALLICGCGGREAVAPEVTAVAAFEDFREAVVDVIEDPDRESQILSLVDEFHADFLELLAAVEEQRTGLRKLNADYDATREQFQDYFDQYAAQIQAARQEAVASRAAFIQATTAEEWDALNKADTKAMKKLVRTIQGI